MEQSVVKSDFMTLAALFVVWLYLNEQVVDILVSLGHLRDPVNENEMPAVLTPDRHLD